MRSTQTEQWAHVTCALWIPEVSLGNYVNKIEPNYYLIKKHYPTPKKCAICKDRSGITIKCQVSDCEKFFHVTCGKKYDLLSLDAKNRNPKNVKYLAKCRKHYLVSPHYIPKSRKSMFSFIPNRFFLETKTRSKSFQKKKAVSTFLPINRFPQAI